MLMDNLDISDIQIGVRTSDWKEAIKKSCKPLLDKGAIEESYVEAIIQSVLDNGPYFVITKGIALAHAKPSYGVNHMAICFSLLDPEVEFGHGNFDPVRLVISSAAIDPDGHLDLLAELADIMMDDDIMEQLYESDTPEKFYNIIKNAL